MLCGSFECHSNANTLRPSYPDCYDFCHTQTATFVGLRRESGLLSMRDAFRLGNDLGTFPQRFKGETFIKRGQT